MRAVNSSTHADRWRAAWTEEAARHDATLAALAAATSDLARIRAAIDVGRLDLDGRTFLVIEVMPSCPV